MELANDELIYQGQKYRREHRIAQVGELVQVVHPMDEEYAEDYKIGEIFTMLETTWGYTLGIDVDKNWHDADEPIFLAHEEYDVILPVKE